MSNAYKKNSITLPGAVAMGTGVMIGAGIFALTGQIAELAGPLFPLSFVVGTIVTAFSAYTYIKMSNAYPSAGGIGMILKKAYGPTTVAAGAALLMALSMVINESLVARTFGTCQRRGESRPRGGAKPGQWRGAERHGPRARHIAGVGHGALARRANRSAADQALVSALRTRL